MGRPGYGVTGIKLRPGDMVASMDVVKPDAELLVVTELGYGKRTPLKEYPSKGRATGGVATIDQQNLKKIGRISTARVVEEEDDLTLISANGLIIRLKVKDISRTGRATRGVRVMDLAPGDKVASLARIGKTEIQTEAGEGNGKESPPG